MILWIWQIYRTGWRIPAAHIYRCIDMHMFPRWTKNILLWHKHSVVFDVMKCKKSVQFRSNPKQWVISNILCTHYYQTYSTYMYKRWKRHFLNWLFVFAKSCEEKYCTWAKTNLWDNDKFSCSLHYIHYFIL